jgi:hypothetical protein
MILEIVFILIIIIIINIFWMFYIKNTYEKKALLAKPYFLLIQLFSAFILIKYINNIYLIIFICIGFFIEIYLIIKYFK